MLKKIKNYLKRLTYWIWEGKYLFLFLLIFIMIFHINKVNIGYKPVDNVRFLGLLLQLLGTITIVKSLKDKLYLFRGHGLSKFLLNYFSRFPLKENTNIHKLKAQVHGISAATAEARGTTKPSEDLNEIIKYIDAEIQYIQNRLVSTKNKLNKDIEDLNIKVEKITNILNKEITETKEIVKDSAISNIWLDSFGLSCIFLGLILGTVPDIIAKYIW